MIHSKIIAFGLALAGLAATTLRAPAQVILTPVILQGTVQLQNTNPVILNWLTNASSPLETYALTVVADAQPPAVPTETSDGVYTNTTDIAYSIILDAGASGVTYEVRPIWDTGPATGEEYYFTPQFTGLIQPGEAPVKMNFSECAGVFDLHFVTSDGAAVPIQGLQVFVQRISDQTTVADSYYGVAEGGSVTNKLLLVPGGGPYALSVTYQTGSNNYVDTLRYTTTVTNAVDCDEVAVVNVVVPSGPNLATVNGNVDMPGEFLLTVPDWPLTGNPDYAGKSVVIANYGPFNNQRWAAVRGSNFTKSASGPFALSNLVPTSVVTPEYGYVVHAEMAMRTNRDYAFFVTPGLGYGPNPGLSLSPGQSTNLGNLFVIQPGYVQAPTVLKGPPETAGWTSGLRNLIFAADSSDGFGFGLPYGSIIYGILDTYAQVMGADDIAGGATYAASGGSSSSGGFGAFNPATASYEGAVNLPVGGLGSEPSRWQRGLYNYDIETGVVDPTNQISMAASIYLQDTNEITVHAGDVISNSLNFSFAMSEIRLNIFSTASQFKDPEINDYSSGQFSGTNYLGVPEDYTVALSYAYGTPDYFTNQGLVVMYMPQGTYTFAPVVVSLNPDGSTSTTALQPVNLTVGVAQRISLQSDLQVQLNAPPFANGAQVPISGQVLGSNTISSVTISVNGAPPATLCAGCGLNPTFSTTVSVDSTECADTTVTVTAVDSLGQTASTTSTIHYDSVPPVITCPGDLTANCGGSDGAVVNFSVTDTDDCSGAVNVVCSPASGSLFPVGTTAVQCTATDAGGNVSQCSFNVTVPPSTLSIRTAVEINWQCGGVLQGAPTPQGPWTDIPGATSPYFTAASGQQQFFRIRN